METIRSVSTVIDATLQVVANSAYSNERKLSKYWYEPAVERQALRALMCGSAFALLAAHGAVAGPALPLQFINRAGEKILCEIGRFLGVTLPELKHHKVSEKKRREKEAGKRGGGNFL